MKTTLTLKLKAGLLGLACACAAGLCIPAHASTTNEIFGSNFDGGGNYAWSYGYSYAGAQIGGNTDPQPSNSGGGAPTAGVGVGGTSALAVSVDYTTLATNANFTNVGNAFNYAGVGTEIAFVGIINPLTPTNALNSIILSFDVKATGLLGTVTTTSVIIEELTFRNSVGGTNVFRFTGSGYVTGTDGVYAHVEIPLHTMTQNIGTAADFTNSALLALIDEYHFKAKIDGMTGSIPSGTRTPVYGSDDNPNAMAYDNLSLKQILADAPAPPTTTNVIFATTFARDEFEVVTNGNYAGSYSFAFAGSQIGGGGATSSGGVSNLVGVAGSDAFSASVDYIALGSSEYTNQANGFTYSGLGCEISFGAPITGITEMATPTIATDSLILSFDVKVGGIVPSGTTGVTIEALDFKISGDGTFFRFSGNGYVTGTNNQFAHVEIQLSSMGFGGGGSRPITDLTNGAVVSSIDSFALKALVRDEIGNIGDGTRMPVYGFDDNNAMTFDNVTLKQITGVQVVVLPEYERTLLDINFDDKKALTYDGFQFRDGAPAAGITGATNASGVAGSMGLVATADFSGWTFGVNEPTGFSGFGNFAVQAIPYTLSTANRAKYRSYLSTRAGGLDSPTYDFANGNASIRFIVPPGTLTPSNAVDEVVLELVPGITYSNDYQSFVFDGGPVGLFNGGSQALFNQYFSKVYKVRVGGQYEGGPNIATYFGYDAGNTMVSDNFKVVETVSGIPPVSVAVVSAQVKVYWANPSNGGVAKLQSCSTVNGTYIDVPGASSGAFSPYTAPAGPQRFYRSKWVP